MSAELSIAEAEILPQDEFWSNFNESICDMPELENITGTVMTKLFHRLDQEYYCRLTNEMYGAARRRRWHINTAHIRDDNYPDFLRSGVFMRPGGQLSGHLCCITVISHQAHCLQIIDNITL